MAAGHDITGLILAGGAGRRVENQDKGLITWQGQPLVAHASACLRSQVADLLISCNRNVARYAKFATHVVVDGRRGFQGPLAGVEAATPHVQTALLVVISCDMPYLPADLVPRLVAPLLSNTRDSPEISYAHDGVRAQYLCAAIHRDCLSSVTTFLDTGGRAVRDWYTTRNTTIVDFSDHGDCFRNVNTLT